MNNNQIIKLVYRKDFNALRQAVAQGANLNSVDEDGRTPLMHAVLATDADLEMISFLMANGANPNTADAGQRWTALHFAARGRHGRL